MLFVVLFLLGCMSLTNLIRNYGNFEEAYYGFGRNVAKASSLEQLEERARDFVSKVIVLHRESLLASYAEVAVTRGLTLEKVDVEQKLLVNERAMHVAPVREIAFRQAILLGVAGRHEEAERFFDLAASAYPADVVTVVGLLKRKAEQDEASFGPLWQHGEGWLRAHPSEKVSGVAPMAKPVSSSGTAGRG